MGRAVEAAFSATWPWLSRSTPSIGQMQWPPFETWTSASNEAIRARQAGSVPTRSMLQNRLDIMDNTPFRGLLAKDVLTGIVARPSVITGRSYDAVSRAYYTAVHAALTRQKSPREALADLEAQLARITGFHPSRN